MERKIIIGLITNTEFLQRLQAEWKLQYIQSNAAKTIARWCWEYYANNEKAPSNNMETIYLKKIRREKKTLSKEVAEEIEEILHSLSSEYEEQEIDIEDLLRETREYFEERQIQIHTEELQVLLEKGEISQAKKLVEDFTIIKEIEEKGLDSSDIEEKLEEAFNTEYQSVLSFPGALGEFWNEQLVRGGFVSLMGSEKRGKTFWLLEFLVRAFRQGRKVAFFQAGDMTENQQIMRFAIYLSKKSNQAKYCGVQYIPTKDCIHNQKDTCTKKEREYRGIGFEIFSEEQFKEGITFTDLKDALKEYPKHRTCYNCLQYEKNKWGVVWLKKLNLGEIPLSLKEAKRNVRKFVRRKQGQFKLSTHVNGTLSIEIIKGILAGWKRDDFKPDLILIDYADLLISEKYRDERHNVNHIWKSLRALSQEYDALVIAPTQADADSYSKDSLGLKNFSEDKRKYGHVTAMYGLNQDKEGREKGIGIMRINKIVIREGDFHSSQEVTVLNRLEIGRPFLNSFK